MFEIRSIFSDVHWVPGAMPDNIMREPDIANAFIFERGGAAYLVDTGVGPGFRHALREFFLGKRFDYATLVNTHHHVDHVCNNDLLTEIDAAEKAHLIHAEGAPYLDPFQSATTILRLASAYYSPFAFEPFPMSVAATLLRALARIAPEQTFALFAKVFLRKFEPIRSKTPYLRPLSLDRRVAIRISEIEFQGWRAGDLQLLDDRGHSPDSVAVYDSSRRVLLLGDLTYEYNPLWPTGTYRTMIENLRAYRALAMSGAVAIVGDGHNHRLFQGVQEILPFLDELIGKHERRRAVITALAEKHALHSVESIRRVIIDEDDEFAELAHEKDFPRALCSTRAMIAVALREAKQGRASIHSG